MHPIPPTPCRHLPSRSGHRGLYMTLGALIVLAVLVVAGIYVPRSVKTHAKSPDAECCRPEFDGGHGNAVRLRSSSAPKLQCTETGFTGRRSGILRRPPIHRLERARVRLRPPLHRQLPPLRDNANAMQPQDAAADGEIEYGSSRQEARGPEWHGGRRSESVKSGDADGAIAERRHVRPDGRVGERRLTSSPTALPP